ncbi:GNAT family N-acetyltransferase [Nakamurella antarctica]|uniref:GNAT family N-acetyltransferase n=1 Tax=Nakamurella antarctica TaxID=1902245 RepID=A0A3G8ZU72_9ACTN|nr:GNAT family N-acetyltransferase [Nakamurella antarctica]AZI58024.1 GNAT family N-acetyltransferase [Nakamurella antarctica]
MAMERIVDDPAAAADAIAAGGLLDRHCLHMVLDLPGFSRRQVGAVGRDTTHSLPRGFAIAPMSPDRAREYGSVIARAYPAAHPDHEPTDSDPESAGQAVLDIMAGLVMGPWIAAASVHISDQTGRIVGHILISETTSHGAGVAGPFVTDICVDPAAARSGLGGALLAESAWRLAEIGWPVVTLVVTVGNPAQRLYERQGFRVVAESWRIETQTEQPSKSPVPT